MAGRPEFKPTKRQRRQVELLAGEIGQAAIARLIGVAENTLAKHFADELAYGRQRVLLDALERLDRAGDAGNVSALKYLAQRKDATPQPAPVAVEPKPKPLGKKVQAEIAAKEAERGTGWADLVH